MSDKDADYWKRKYESLMEGVIALQGKLSDAVQQNTMLVLEKKQWEADKATQQLIIQQALNGANSQSQSQGEEIQSLKEEIKRLKGE